MQEHSISLDESLSQSQLQSHYQSQPQRNLDLLRTPLTTANRSPVPEAHTQTPFSIQTSPKTHQEPTQELSPRQRFNTIKQNLLSNNNNLTTVTGPREIERNLNTELLIAGDSLSVYNNVDKMLEKIKSKREGWSVVDKLAVNLAQTEARSQAFNKIDHKFHVDDDVDTLVETIKNATRKKFEPIKQPQPQKEFESPVKDSSIASPKPSTVNKGTQSPHQWEAPERDQQPQKAPEIQKNQPPSISPSKAMKDAEVNTSNLANQLDSAERENNPNRANQILRNYPKNRGILDNFADDFKSNKTESFDEESLASSRTIGNMSQAKSSQGSLSFNISQSMINSPDLSKVMAEYNQENTPVDIPKKEINNAPLLPKKESAPGKIPLAPVHTQSKEPKESKQSARSGEPVHIEKPSVREPEPSPPKIQEDEVLNYVNEEETFRAPIPQQQESKPKIIQQRKTSDVKPREARPKFMNSFKSRIAQLKNANPHRVHDEDEETGQEAPKPRPDLQIETTSELKKGPENKENKTDYRQPQVHSPVSLREENEDDLHMDDLMSYSKATESRIDHRQDLEDRSPLRHEELQDSAAKPFKGLSPTPKRHLDFENASEISFNYSPEQSALIADFLNNKNGENQSRKASHPNLPLPFHKLEFVWDEQKEKAFEEYCNKDLEIMKLRNKINFLKDEIALLKIQGKK